MLLSANEIEAPLPRLAAVPQVSVSAPLLEVRGITKDFPGQRALDNVDLVVQPGEIHALLGENGAGKSTLIKILAGALQPDSGTIRIAGQEVSLAKPQDAVANGIAVSHQHVALIPSLSVAENLLLGEQLPRRLKLLVDWKSVNQRARTLLDSLGLNINPDALVSTLRPDEVALVGIARAIATNAKLIILDEPTTTLLPREVAILFRHMRRLAREGHSFIYVSHRLAEVFEIADSATVLRDGKLTWACERAAMTTRNVVAAILGADEATLEDAAAPQTSPGAVVLEVHRLQGRFVQDVSFEARAGEIVGLAGLPGSGADEILDLLYGRNPLSGGHIRLQSASYVPRSPRAAVKAGIALVPKERLAESVFPALSVRENISISSLQKYLTEPLLRLVRKGAEKKAVQQLADSLHLKTPTIETRMDALSGGNQQKAVIARWVATQARLYLLNSPTAAVDVGAKAEIYALLGELAKAGACILFTTTELEEFPRLCRRVIVLRKGQIAGELVGSDITEANIMHLSIGDHLEAI